MTTKSSGKPIVWLLAGIGILVAFCGVGSILPRAVQAPAVILGVAGFLFCWRRGLALWRVDDLVIERPAAGQAVAFRGSIPFPRITVPRWRVESGAPE